MEEIKQIALIYFSKANAPVSPTKQIRIEKTNIYKQMGELVSAFTRREKPQRTIQVVIQLWSHTAKIAKMNKSLKKINVKARKEKLKTLHDELFMAWKNKDAAHMWTVSKILAGKSALRAKSLVRLSGLEWQQGLCRPGNQGGILAQPIND